MRRLAKETWKRKNRYHPNNCELRKRWSMASKKFRQKTKRSHSSQSSRRWRTRLLWLTIALAVAGASFLTARLVMQSRGEARLQQTKVQSNVSVEPEQPSADTAWDPAWPRLPGSGPPARPIEVVRAAYAYAVRRGDVLQYMPCYCGCEKQGHRSNRDCFVKTKTAGLPKWDAMGYG